MASSVAQFVAKCQSTATVLPRVQTAATAASAAAVKDTLIAAGHAARIPSSSRWGVRYLLAGSRGTTDSAVVFYWGAAPYWVQQGTKPHVIAPKGLGGRRAARQSAVASIIADRGSNLGRFGKRAAIVINGHPYAYARQPGARPRPFWRGAKQAAFRVVPPTYQSAYRRALTEVF